jgi:hypothetical protein
MPLIIANWHAPVSFPFELQKLCEQSPWPRLLAKLRASEPSGSLRANLPKFDEPQYAERHVLCCGGTRATRLLLPVFSAIAGEIRSRSSNGTITALAGL